nr:hypothetical protein DA06_20965 [Georgenia sp. SUBG003]
MRLAARGELVEGQDDEEVDRGRDKEKVDERGDDGARLDQGVADPELEELGEVRLAHQPGDQRVEQGVDDGVHDSGERGADDHAHRKVDGVPPGDELPETSKHATSFTSGVTRGPGVTDS